MAETHKYRVTVENVTYDEEGTEVKAELMVQFDATHVDIQQRKGDCRRVFARSCNCASCLLLARNMQKESTR